MRAKLRERLDGDELLVLPGAANALGARIIEDVGFEAAYVTGAGVANTFLGAPDLALLSLTQMADHVAAMSAAVSIPLVVDADTGYGNAVNVRHTVRVLERAGASAIQLEDQTFPKRCGHFDGKDVIESHEMVQKIHAAVEARDDQDLVLIARTDARAVHGIEEACRRANLYRDAGADVLFVEAPLDEREIEYVARHVEGRKMINYVEGGSTPELPHERLAELGFGVALYANLALLAGVGAMQRVLSELLTTGATSESGAQNASWDERQRLVRTPEYMELSERYA